MIVRERADVAHRRDDRELRGDGEAAHFVRRRRTLDAGPEDQHGTARVTHRRKQPIEPGCVVERRWHPH